MKFSVLQENLQRGLATVMPAVATRTTMPITTHVMLQADESRLRLTATNLELSISCWISASVETQGSVAIPARLFSDYVSSLQRDRVDLELDAATRQLNIISGRFNTHMSGLDADDFPPTPVADDGISAEVPPDVLRAGIDRVVIAAATEDSRPVLTGIHTSIEGDSITMAAADGFRLAVQTTKLPQEVGEGVDLIIPARSLRELNRMLSEQEMPVRVTVNQAKTQVQFHLNNIVLGSQLIQGNFPNYRQLIPESSNTQTSVEVADFLRATKTAAVFAREGNGIVRLYMTPGENEMAGTMRLEARSDQIGDHEGVIDANIGGEEAHIAFNHRYLEDVLGVLNSTATLEVSGPSSPGTIRPASTDDGTEYIHVVMPMFVQW
jgi:DNA polymerase-3 subunit beta